jgi:hypothetical protein
MTAPDRVVSHSVALATPRPPTLETVPDTPLATHLATLGGHRQRSLTRPVAQAIRPHGHEPPAPMR